MTKGLYTFIFKLLYYHFVIIHRSKSIAFKFSKDLFKNYDFRQVEQDDLSPACQERASVGETPENASLLRQILHTHTAGQCFFSNMDKRTK